MPTRVVCVIPTFQPDASLLSRLRAVRSSVDLVVVSDDASSCSSDLVLAGAINEGVTVVRHAHNCGIARGLNDGLRLAADLGADWLLSVDQDTDLEEDHVTRLLADARSRGAAGVRVGAIGVPLIVDVSGSIHIPGRPTAQGDETEELIQSGTLWSIAALEDIGGFDESLGIDAVDAAACLRLRERGYSVCLTPGTSVRHRIGAARIVRVFGHEAMITGHSPGRRTTMLRNRLRLFPAEFHQSPRHALRTLRRVSINQFLGLILERDKWSKARGSARALLPRSDPDD
jgi:rhamnosyltransferase